MYAPVMDVYPLTEAGAYLGELVDEARHRHRPVAISEHGKPVAVIMGVEDLADLEDSLAVARHEADKAVGRVTGVTDADLDGRSTGTRQAARGPDGRLQGDDAPALRGQGQAPEQAGRTGSAGRSEVVDEQASDVAAVQHVPVALVDLIQRVPGGD
jgi:prevent-host-death family protein